MSLTEKPHFPRLQGWDLIDNEIVLPHDVDHEYWLLIITYKRWHEDVIDTWLPYFEHMTRQFDRLKVYYLSMFKPRPPLMRTIITGYMKRRYASKAERLSHIMVYTDIEAFNSSLELPGTHTIYLLLVDRVGQVIWCGENMFDQQQFDSLNSAIRQLLHEAAPS
jgi:hypothetical protein